MDSYHMNTTDVEKVSFTERNDVDTMIRLSSKDITVMIGHLFWFGPLKYQSGTFRPIKYTGSTLKLRPVKLLFKT